MSEEKKTTDSEESVEGFFDTLIEDFSTEAPLENGGDEGNDTDSEKGFSKFFEDAAAFGNAFQSTIDKTPDEISSPDSEDTVVDFTSEGNAEQVIQPAEEVKPEPEKETITTPVTDEDGMIVIFDDDAGINATGVDMPDANDDSNREVIDDVSEHPGLIRGLFPMKGDSAGEVIRKCVFLLSACVFVGAGVMLASTLIQSKEAVEDLEKLQSEITTTVATTINEDGEIVTIPPTIEEREEHHESLMNSFVEVSGDVVGFIEVDSCGISYPVVQGPDNEYYLTHTYDNKKNKAGSVFMDYRCTLSDGYCSPNIVLYGHNQEDGTMFGNLKNFKNNVEFYRENPEVSFNSVNGLGDYVIFAYFISNVHEYQDSEGEVFHYHDYIDTLNSEATFNWYMKEVGERNQIISPVDVQFGDQLLVLSTCSNEYFDSRFVVMARKLRDGESYSDFDFKKARLNPDARQIDWDAIYSRTTPTESTTTTVPTTTTQATTTVPVTTTVTTTVPTTVTTVAPTTAETTTIDYESVSISESESVSASISESVSLSESIASAISRDQANAGPH